MIFRLQIVFVECGERSSLSCNYCFKNKARFSCGLGVQIEKACFSNYEAAVKEVYKADALCKLEVECKVPVAQKTAPSLATAVASGIESRCEVNIPTPIPEFRL